VNDQKSYAHLNEVMDALKRGETVLIQAPVKTRFRLESDRIRVNQTHFQTLVDWETFKDLYGSALFYVVEASNDPEIDPLKDVEYYAFKHK
jgi:hypothetical protein